MPENVYTYESLALGVNMSGSLTRFYYPNAGHLPGTDWINPTSGVAEGARIIGNGTSLAASIVTGNGFTGNAQRLSSDGGSYFRLYWFTGIQLPDADTTAPFLDVTLTYRCSAFTRIGTGGGLPDGVATNTGNAITETVRVTRYADDVPNRQIMIQLNTGGQSGHWFEVDDISWVYID